LNPQQFHQRVVYSEGTDPNIYKCDIGNDIASGAAGGAKASRRNWLIGILGFSKNEWTRAFKPLHME